jgi:ribose-phosphate pyrophosphokinase
MENLHASFEIIRSLNDIGVAKDNLVVVSPDTGAVSRNKFFSEALGVPLAILYKERDYSKVTLSAESTNITSMKLLGDISGKMCLICDDMIDTGGTILRAASELKRLGAAGVIFAASLPFFNDGAIKSFDEAYKREEFKYVIGTNAVYQTELWTREWFIRADISQLFAEVISRLHTGKSLSALLERVNFQTSGGQSGVS